MHVCVSDFACMYVSDCACIRLYVDLVVGTITQRRPELSYVYEYVMTPIAGPMPESAGWQALSASILTGT